MYSKIKKEKPLVFIVEDSAAYRVLLGRVLENRGFMVMMFEHGRKAADMLNYVKPTLILSDISMPCMDGFEFHEYVKRNFGKLNIPFVYLSSSTSETDKRKALNMGARRILRKPISPQNLASILDTVLEEEQMVS